MQISLEIDKCIGCKLCEIVCTLTNESCINPSRSRIEVIKVNPEVDIPVYCYQCTDAPCAEVCPVNAISRNKDGVMEIDDKVCINCRACSKACPFGSIGINSDGKVFKCEMCDGDPECVKICPTHALKYEQPEAMTYKKRSKFAEKYLETSSQAW